MRRVFTLIVLILVITLISLPTTVLGLTNVQKKAANNFNQVKFTANNYEVSSYSSYNKENKKIENNLQVKNKINNKVKIYKSNEYTLNKKEDSSTTIYSIEIPSFGKFSANLDNYTKKVTTASFTSFSNVVASQVQKKQNAKAESKSVTTNNTNSASLTREEVNPDRIGLPPVNPPPAINPIPVPDTIPYEPNNPNSNNNGVDYDPRTPGHIKIMVLGDSNSQPLIPGVPNSQQPYFIQDRGFINWVDVLANRVANEGIIVETYNLSVGGTTVSDWNTLNTYGDPNINGTPFITPAKLAEIQSYGYVDYLVIALGTNDIIEKVGDGNEGTVPYINNLVNMISQVRATIPFFKLIIIEPPMIRPTVLSNGTVVYTPEQAQMVTNYSNAIEEMTRSNQQFKELQSWYQFRAEYVVTKWMITDSDINWDGVHLLNSGETKLGDYMFQPLNLIPDSGNIGGLGGAN